jgi:hypothetical protein
MNRLPVAKRAQMYIGAEPGPIGAATIGNTRGFARL